MINQKIKSIPITRAKSLIRLTINAFKALEIAFIRVYQKPIKRYEQRPTPSQPKNNCTKLSAVTRTNIKKVKKEI